MASNLDLLEDAADKLKQLKEEVVFVGGSILDLLITDKAASPVRATLDVDAIAEITTYGDYLLFAERLRELGFREDTRKDAPLCRWTHGDLILDLMPLDAKVLGFSNIWYRGALETAKLATLPSGTAVRLITAPFFLGVKMAAFRSRGGGDFFASHDLEDFIAVIDGRETLLAEIGIAPVGLVKYLAEAAGELLAASRFRDALPGYLPGDSISQLRVPFLLQKLTQMTKV